MTTTRWVRHPDARIYDRGERTVLCSARGGRALIGDSAALARVVLARLLEGPADRAELLAVVSRAAGAPVEDASVVDQLLALLADAGAIAAEGRAAAPARAATPLRVLVCGTGAIGTALLPELVLRLRTRGHTSRAALTREARRFVSVAALEALTGARVHDDAWDGTAEAPVPHLELAAWAEVVAIAPASATTISRLSRGDCSCVVSALALSTRAPVLVAPAMNPAMWAAPAIVRNVAQLSADGFAVVHPAPALEVHDGRTVEQGGAPGPAALVDLIEQLAAEAR